MRRDTLPTVWRRGEPKETAQIGVTRKHMTYAEQSYNQQALAQQSYFSDLANAYAGGIGGSGSIVFAPQGHQYPGVTP